MSMKRQQPREDVAGSRMMNPFPCACATPGRQHLAATGIPSNWFVRGEGSQCPPFVRSFVSFLRKAETRLDGSSSSSSPPAPHNFTSVSRMLLHHEQQRQPSVSHSSMHETFPSVALPNSSPILPSTEPQFLHRREKTQGQRKEYTQAPPFPNRMPTSIPKPR